MFVTRRDYALSAGHGTEIPGHDASSSSIYNPLEGVLNHLRHLSAQGGGGAPFACVTRALGLRGGHAAKSMKEAKTGVEFPENYCHLSRKDCPSLMGVGYAHQPVFHSACDCSLGPVDL